MTAPLTVEDHKKRVRAAFDKFFTKEDCPHCGLPYWNGTLHAYGGVWNRKKSEQHWCNGKIDFYPKRKEDKDLGKEENPKQMELNLGIKETK
jgi:hypothetical protein